MNKPAQSSAGTDPRWTQPSTLSVQGFGIREIVAIIRRRKRTILGIAFGGALLAAVVLPLITPHYTAQTLIMIEGRTRNIMKVDSVVPGLPGDAETIEGEMQILGSRELANQVMLKLKLYQDPEFRGSAGLSETGLDPDRRSRIVDSLLNRLQISHKGRSRVLAVEFTSVKPTKAALVANTFAEQYLVAQLESKFRATQAATGWLDERVTELSDKVAASERAVEDFRRKSGLLQGEAPQSELIRQLRMKEAETQRQLAELANEYGEQHPKLINLRAEARKLQQSIRAEFDQNRAQVPLRALEREAESSRMLLNTFLARLKETSAQQDITGQQPDAQIISRADTPIRPSFPKALPILALTLTGSTLIGLLVAFLTEHLDRGFRSAEELEEVTGVTSLGFAPLGGAMGEGATAVTYALEYPKSAFAESIRTLAWSLTLSHSEDPPKKVLITSAEPGEGKTTIAACLAELQALSGKKVLLIDTDSRRPAVGPTLGAGEGAGLTELILEQVQLKQVVWKDKRTGLDVIRSGKSPLDVPSMLASQRMDALLNTLSARYDLIVLDSPPVMVAADARVLSAKVDATIFVVRWAQTPRDVVNAALRQLQSSGGYLAGALLNMVDLKKYAPYGYGDSGYYHDRLKGYYAEEPDSGRVPGLMGLASSPKELLRMLYSGRVPGLMGLATSPKALWRRLRSTVGARLR